MATPFREWLKNAKIAYWLIVGGLADSGVFSGAELYDPATGAFTDTASLNEARFGHTATLLPDGQVLVAGGWDGSSYLSSIELYNPATGAFVGVDGSAANVRQSCEKSLKRLDAEKGEWNGNQWLFHNVLITQFREGGFPLLSKVPQEVIDLPEKPSDFKMIQKDIESMGYFELDRYIRKLQSEGYDATWYIVDLQGKIAFVFVSLILALIGVVFPMRSERSGGMAQGIGIGVIIGFSYWIVFAFTLSLGRSGTLPPVVAAWATNVILGVVAFVMYRRVNT